MGSESVKGFSLEEEPSPQQQGKVIRVEIVPSSKVRENKRDVSVLLSSVKIEDFGPKVEQFDIFDFKKSVTYRAIEQAAIISEGLEYRRDEDSGRRLLDLDSNTGLEVCRSYLSCVERLSA
jgi:hypothetical protein